MAATSPRNGQVDNKMAAASQKNCRDEEQYGCCFAKALCSMRYKMAAAHRLDEEQDGCRFAEKLSG
jgi:hypothetical protein